MSFVPACDVQLLLDTHTLTHTHTRAHTHTPQMQLTATGLMPASESEEEATQTLSAPKRVRRIDFKAFVSFCAFAYFDRLSTGGWLCKKVCLRLACVLQNVDLFVSLLNCICNDLPCVS